jgi:hypothetical protein
MLDGREPQAAVEAMFDRLPKKRRWWSTPVTVWLSGALARPFTFGPVAGLKGFKEAHDAAAAMAPTACGLEVPCVAYLEDDPSRGVVLATAVERSLLDTLEQVANVRRLRVAHVRPVWAVLSDHAAAEEGLRCCRDCDALTVLARHRGVWSFAAAYAPAPDGVAARSLLQRLEASAGVDAHQTTVAAIEVPAPGQMPRAQVLALGIEALA